QYARDAAAERARRQRARGTTSPAGTGRQPATRLGSNLIAAALLGAIERLVGRPHDLPGVRHGRAPGVRHADADRDGEARPRLARDRRLRARAWAASGTQGEGCALDPPAQRLEVTANLVDVLAGEQPREFLAAVPERASAAADVPQPGADHPQELVTDVVPVFVVKALEVVGVHHRHRVGVAELGERFVEGAPRRQTG